MRNLCCLGKTLAVAALCCSVAFAADGQNTALTTSGATPTTASTGGSGIQAGGGCADITLSQQALDASPLAGNGVACVNGNNPFCFTTSNWFARSFDLSVGETAGQDFTVKCVDFGIESNMAGDPNCGGNGGPLTVTVSLYVDINGGAPVAPGIDLVLQGAVDVIVPDGASLQVFTANFGAGVVIPADSTLVVEHGHPTRNPAGGGDGGLGWPGADGSKSQSGPSYFRSDQCGCCNTYVTTDSIDFPQSRWVMRVDGDVDVEPTGACCDDGEASCEENQTREECPDSSRWRVGQACDELDPPCGQLNDECPAAELITCGSVTVFDNTQGTQNLQDDPFICSPDGQGQQPEHTLFYKFVATATSATVSTCDTDENGASNTIVSMYSSCDVFIDEIGCDHDRCDPHASLCVDGLTIGDEYIILVSQVGGAPGSVTLNLDCTPECAVDPVGACCLDGGDLCFDLPEPECRDNNGVWVGEGTTCDDDPDPCSLECGTGDVLWDNNVTPDGFSGRAVSPPGFPLIRVMDDFLVPNGITWNIEDFHTNMIEDAGWTPGRLIEIFVRAHDANTGGPVNGAGNELVNVLRSTLTRTATGVQYFGRDDYDYCILFEEDTFQLSGGHYWIGSRNPGGGGSGTNYWMTSDGGPDGGGTGTGWFSLDAGATFNDEGAGWQHAFEVTGSLGEAQSGACCHGDGTCDDGVDGEECSDEFDRFAANTLCANLDPPCAEATGGCCIEGGCTRNPPWICDGDTDGDGVVNPVDSGLVQANFGSTDEADLCQYDVDCDGVINPVDSGIVQSLFGTCNDPRDSCGGGGGGECVELGPTDCAARGGEFLGIGTDCADDPCGLAPGACCEDDACADGVREGDCGGEWFEGADCADDPCGLALGACCDVGDCVGTTREADCPNTWFDGEDCDAGFECPNTCFWDNNMVPDGFSGRAVSPPNFPDIRVVDDIDVDACIVATLRMNIIEDAGWANGGNITVYVYDDGGAGGSPGSLFDSQTTSSFTRVATGVQYFGRDDYDYTVTGLSLDLPGGTWWIGTRNANGGGSGTNYWMTSDGGPDGGGTDTGWFSLDGGASFAPEGAGWQHAFEILP